MNPADAAGPRPLSARQEELLRHRVDAEQTGGAAVPIRRTARPAHAHPTPGRQPARPGSATAARRKARRRAAGAARAAERRARRAERLRNRRRVDWARVLFRVAVLLLIAEGCVAAGWSPRLWVRRVVVEGNATVPAERLVDAAAIGPRTNLFSVPLARLTAAAEAEPAVAKASAYRVLPDTLKVVVEERKPLAVVRFDGSKNCYTIDQDLVPFRRSEVRDVSLPLITSAALPTRNPVLGRRLHLSGLEGAVACLPWAKERGTAFPVAKVSIDAWGKLCLNRVGGLTVRLGSAYELEEKLRALDHLMARRPDLAGGAPSPVATIDLIAHDAPALIASIAVPQAPASSSVVR